MIKTNRTSNEMYFVHRAFYNIFLNFFGELIYKMMVLDLKRSWSAVRSTAAGSLFHSLSAADRSTL